MAETMAKDATKTGKARAGKYLTFKLESEEFGLEILKVQEIIQMQSITRVPRTPPFVRGVINLRGKVIPVVDLRLKFAMDHAEDTERTCIVVVQIRNENSVVVMGTIIDEVREVLDIPEASIEDTPSFGTSIDTEFILGMGKIGQNVRILLDIDKVLSAQELSSVTAAAGAPA